MERVSELRVVKRSIWGEFSYRLNWIVFGTIGAILLAMIPVLGWILAIGVVLALLWKVFGFRETQLVGDCPVCTNPLQVEPKTKVLACPVCQSCIAVRDDHLAQIQID